MIMKIDYTRDFCDTVHGRILEFAALHFRGKEGDTFDGRFANQITEKQPALLASIDFIYTFHIAGLLDKVTTAQSRENWANFIISAQDQDGWFKSDDVQGHSYYHSTAYALGGLLLLGACDKKDYLIYLKPFTDLQKEITTSPSRDIPPFGMSFVEKMHFWRGSHKAGGIPAIVGQVDKSSGLTEKLLGIKDGTQWLRSWADYFISKMDLKTGVWTLVPWPADIAFGQVLKRKHRPELAKIGGAVHLYWIFSRMGLKYPCPEELAAYVLKQNPKGGLYEKFPYCLDFDSNFLISRSFSLLTSEELKEGVKRSLTLNRNAILSYFLEKDPREWYLRAHPFPGALAAVAEADRILEKENPFFKDAFEIVWWL